MGLPSGVSSGLENRRRKSRKAVLSLTGVAVFFIAIACFVVLFAGGVLDLLPASGPSSGGYDVDTAVQDLLDAISAEPERVDLYLELADLYMSSDMKDCEAAVEILEKCTTVNPESPDPYLKLGTAQMMLGHNTAALRALEEYERLSASA